jgi:hypothetical protein
VIPWRSFRSTLMWRDSVSDTESTACLLLMATEHSFLGIIWNFIKLTIGFDHNFFGLLVCFHPRCHQTSAATVSDPMRVWRVRTICFFSMSNDTKFANTMSDNNVLTMTTCRPLSPNKGLECDECSIRYKLFNGPICRFGQ